MNRRLIAVSLALMGGVMLSAWYFSASSPDADPDFSQTDPTAEIRPVVAGIQDAAMPAEVLAPLPVSGNQHSVPLQVQPEDRESRELFEQLLRDYGSGELTTDDKILIERTLRELNQEEIGRAFIIETFFSREEPQLAAALYNLMLDADLKSVALLEGLIQRDSSELEVPSKLRIVDLIADLGAQDEAPYSPLVDEYLVHVAINSDTKLRNAAVSRRIWYLAHHQPDNLAVLGEYLLDPAQQVREEMYSLISARADSKQLTGQAELGLALEATLHADYLGLSDQEQTRIKQLLASLADR